MMPAIALRTTGFMRAVTENRAPFRRAALMNLCWKNAESVRAIIVVLRGSIPAPRAALIPAASSRSAPPAEVVFSLHSLVAGVLFRRVSGGVRGLPAKTIDTVLGATGAGSPARTRRRHRRWT